MGSEKQEAALDCTRIAQDARRIPDWLRPYKDQWLSAGKIQSLVAAEGRYFSPWFEDVRPRLRCIMEPVRNGKTASKYLVRQVWAASLAHGLRLIPTEESKPEKQLREELEALRQDLARERAKVRIEYVEVDRTAASIETIRLLFSVTEPQPRPGVYFLLDSDGEVVYVGQSKNVLSRMVGHGAKGYASVRMVHVEDERQRLEVESLLIKWLQPPLNVKGMDTPREARARQ